MLLVSCFQSNTAFPRLANHHCLFLYLHFTHGDEKGIKLIQQGINLSLAFSSLCLLPAAKRSARRHWACTPTSRAWYVGVSGGLRWCPGKTSGKSASWGSPRSAPPIRWARQRPCPLSATIPAALGHGGGRGSLTAARPTSHTHTDRQPPLTPACVTLGETLFSWTARKSPLSCQICWVLMQASGDPCSFSVVHPSTLTLSKVPHSVKLRCSLYGPIKCLSVREGEVREKTGHIGM